LQTLSKVNAVRWGFEQVFGPNCEVRAVRSNSQVANQPIGFAAGKQGAENRAEEVELVHPTELIVSIESFVVRGVVRADDLSPL
jgi:non-canonical (house-cleaning) NTP pyrophosphatase